jgi:hypothetical protein
MVNDGTSKSEHAAYICGRATPASQVRREWAAVSRLDATDRVADAGDAVRRTR